MANEMRDRLVELIQNSVDGCARHWAEIIADHLIANGVIVPPCKIYDTVYEVIAYKNKANKNRIDGHIRSCIVKSIHLSDAHSKKDEPYITLGAGGCYRNGAYIKRVHIDEFGKSVFLTKEQAEQKLKEMRGENE